MPLGQKGVSLGADLSYNQFDIRDLFPIGKTIEHFFFQFFHIFP